MFFLAALYSLVQLQKDLYNTGIKDCHKAINVPVSDQSSMHYTVRFDKFDSVESVITKRLALYFPKMGDDFKNQILELIKPYLEKSVWETTKSYVVIVNGFDASNQKSAMITFRLSNDELTETVRQQAISLDIQSSVSTSSYLESIYTYTAFDFTDQVISNVKTNIKKDQVTLNIVRVLVPAVAPLYYGSTILQKNVVVKPSIAYISQYLSNYCQLLNFDEEDAKEEIDSFNKLGYVDFNSIASRVLKVCLTTPTPSPKPTPDPSQPETDDDTSFDFDEDEFREHFSHIFGRRKSRRSSNSHSKSHRRYRHHRQE